MGLWASVCMVVTLAALAMLLRPAERVAARQTSQATPDTGQQVADTAAGKSLPQENAPPVATTDTMVAPQAIAITDSFSRGPRQPLPFNHVWHAGQLQISCQYCHVIADPDSTKGEQVVVPPVSLCMGCHRVAGSELKPIQELRGYWKRKETIPWKKVNDLPEFVQFVHQPHLRNGIDCETCHGPVKETMARVYQWAPLTMGWCLSCHRGKPEPTDTATDYSLSRRYPPPPTPAGKETPGLYPKSLNSDYAETRAPTECVACHH